MKTPADALRDLQPFLRTQPLGATEIESVADAFLSDGVSPEIKADFLLAWAQRGETAGELAALAKAYLPTSRNPGLCGSWNGQPLLDCCGTGGGGLNLINFSTGMMFVLAAMGVPVVKHGNRGQTKKSGSADVLEALDLKIDFLGENCRQCLEEVGCVFLFAPSFYPAFAAIAPARRQLAAIGQRSVFNLLGPLLNPAQPDARLVGVFQPEHVHLYCEALQNLPCARFTIACGQDQDSGRMLGEVSANGRTWLAHSGLTDAKLPPDHLHRTFSPPSLDTLLVADASESASRLLRLFRGEESGLARETLVLNSALAAWTQGKVSSLEEGLDAAGEALDSRGALACLERWRRHFPA